MKSTARLLLFVLLGMFRSAASAEVLPFMRPALIGLGRS